MKEIAEEDCTPEARMKALQTVLLGRVLPQNNLHNNNTAKSLEQERQEVRKVVLAVLAEMRDSLNSCRKDFEDALVLSLTTDVPQNANGAQIHWRKSTRLRWNWPNSSLTVSAPSGLAI